jgi:hypothetical protein
MPNQKYLYLYGGLFFVFSSTWDQIYARKKHLATELQTQLQSLVFLSGDGEEIKENDGVGEFD